MSNPASGRAGASQPEGDLRCALLIGTGLSFCNLQLTRRLNLLDLNLPNLTEDGRRQLLAHQLHNLHLSEAEIARCLKERSLQSLSADTMGMPGAVMHLMQAIQDHYSKGHEIGRYIRCLCSCKKGQPVNLQKLSDYVFRSPCHHP